MFRSRGVVTEEKERKKSVQLRISGIILTQHPQNKKVENREVNSESSSDDIALLSVPHGMAVSCTVYLLMTSQ